MHISEGLLDPKICIAGYAAATVLLGITLKKTSLDSVPKVSIMGAAFFTASLIHFKIGITSIHLTLIGLTSLILGVSAIPAISAGLFFQAALFGHGGLSTLGINILIFGLPSLIVYGLFVFIRSFFKHKYLPFFAGILSFIASLLSTLIASFVIYLSGESFASLAWIFSGANLFLAFIEGIIAYIAIKRILFSKPQLILNT